MSHISGTREAISLKFGMWSAAVGGHVHSKNRLVSSRKHRATEVRKLRFLSSCQYTHGCYAPASWAARHTTVCLDSSLLKLLRVTAWILRFVDKLWKRDHRTGPLSAEEVQVARLMWEKNIQLKSYSDVIDRVQQGRKNNTVHQLNLQLESNGLLRCHGQFGNADLTQGAKFPKLLPKDEYFTQLVINDVHTKILHSGVSQTLATI